MVGIPLVRITMMMMTMWYTCLVHHFSLDWNDKVIALGVQREEKKWQESSSPLCVLCRSASYSSAFFLYHTSVHLCNFACHVIFIVLYFIEYIESEIAFYCSLVSRKSVSVCINFSVIFYAWGYVHVYYICIGMIKIGIPSEKLTRSKPEK